MFNDKEIIEKLDNLKEELEEVKNNNDNLESLHKENFTKISEELNNLKKQQFTFSVNAEKEIEDMKVLKNQLRKSVSSFEQMHSKIYDTIYTKIHDILENHSKDIKYSTEKYKSLTPAVQKIIEDLDLLKKEINKFNTISQNLKETDFELVQHQKNLERHEWEKLKLMKKVDSLQRLVGKLRRNY